MPKTSYKTIDEYHHTFSGVALERMRVIRKIIHEIAPEVEEVISYQIPAFKIGDKFRLIYYCAFPNHLSISSPWSSELLKKFEDDLADLKVSKSVIQFPHDKPLPMELIERILKFRKTEFSKVMKK